MKNMRALIGLPVISNGKKIGRVIRCELSEDLSMLEGIWITAVFFGARFVPRDHLGVLGEVSIVSDTAGYRKRCRDKSTLRRAVGTDGRRIGAITGAEIDELTFQVQALELSCGIWDDLLDGRKRVHTFILNQNNGSVVIDDSEL